MKFVKGKYYKVIDNTGSIVASGQLINLKYSVTCSRSMKKVMFNIPYISFDDKWFFNTNSERFKIEESKEKVPLLLNIQKDQIEEKPESTTWTTVDIYREHNIDELDQEVKGLVEALNNSGFQTVSSCCGHGDKNLFVDILFRDFIQLEKFITFIEKNCGSEFIVTSWFSHVNDNHSCIQLRLLSIDIGEQAYVAAKHLSQLLSLLS